MSEIAPTSRGPQGRLFFAVWPDEAGAAALALLGTRLAEVAGGKPVPAGKIHLTLAFLGAIDAGARDAAIEAARGTSGRAFTLAVDQTGCFRRARVAWAGVSAPPAPLIALQSALALALVARGLELDARPYVPHVTLVRNANRPVAPALIEPIAWRAGGFTLVRSETGAGRYVVEERWELGS